MKLYKFYYNANQNDIAHDIDDVKRSIKTESEYIMDKYPLYAYTPDKKTYKEFKNERNMDSFIIIKTDIDRDDYIEYAETHRDALLDIVPIKVKDDKGISCDMDFAITKYEQLVMEDVDVEYLFAASCEFIPQYIFNKKIIQALQILEYPFFARIVGSDYFDDDDFDYDQADVQLNEFEILYSQFYGTF